ncbi:hypothetical protein ACOKFD_04095 [Flagellimonas sp. S174]|uniref:hypothetical protein n=1 Tax=Flagellimonas sp. S174 TaxID=3410790 RepID=UPI003BF554BD
MLNTISKLPKMILFCLDSTNDIFFFFEVEDFDFVLFLAIKNLDNGANLQIYVSSSASG